MKIRMTSRLGLKVALTVRLRYTRHEMLSPVGLIDFYSSVSVFEAGQNQTY